MEQTAKNIKKVSLPEDNKKEQFIGFVIKFGTKNVTDINDVVTVGPQYFVGRG